MTREMPVRARYVLAIALASAMMAASASAIAADAGKGQEGLQEVQGLPHRRGGRKSTSRAPTCTEVFGRTSGTAEGFKKYSKAMKEAGIVWSEETILAYITDPKGYIPKNKMAFRGGQEGKGPPEPDRLSQGSDRRRVTREVAIGAG